MAEMHVQIHEHIDASVLNLVAAVLPSISMNGVEFLAHLCRHAQAKQVALFAGHPSVAVVSCQRLSDLITGWRWARETSLLLFQALETLMVLVRIRRKGQTEIHIPLGMRHLAYPVLLARLKRHKTQSKKAQRLFARMAARFEEYLVLQSPAQTNGSIGTREGSWSPEQIEQLETALTEEHLSPARRHRVLFRLLAPVPSEREQESLGINDHEASVPLPPMQLVVDGNSSEADEEDQSVLQTETHQRGEKPAQKGQEEPQSFRGSSQERHEMTSLPELLPPSLSPEEDPIPQPVECEMRSLSAASLQNETTWIGSWVMNQVQQATARGQAQLAELEQWQEQHPELVRAAMISTLMQCVFPDHHGIPRNRWRWLASTYEGYRKGKFPIPDAVASWVESPSTLEEIAQTLELVRFQQEQQMQPPVRPFAAEAEQIVAMQEAIASYTADDDAVQDSQMPRSLSSMVLEEPIPVGRIPVSSTEEARSITSDVVTWEQPHPLLRSEQANHLSEGSVPSTSMVVFSEQTPAAPLEDQIHTPEAPIIEVETPEEGFANHESAWWWEDKIRNSSLVETCSITTLPTRYGRWGIWVIPHERPEDAWIWTSGRAIRQYLEVLRAAEHI